MPNAETVLGGIAGALHGGLNEYARQQDYRQKDRAIESRDEQSQLRAEVQQMIAQLNATSREKVAQTGADSREKVAETNQAGANARHDTASGSVIENNRGAMERLKQNIDFGYDKTFLEESGRNKRWAAPSGNATLGAQTTRRGQDVSAETTRRGQDKTFDLGTQRDSTTRRGQDNTFKLGTDRNAILKKKGSIYDNLFAPEGGGGTEPPPDVNLPNEPTAPPARGPIPMVPRGAAAPLPTPTDVSEDDLDTLAKSVLVGQGVPTTPENIKTFKDRNRDRLIQQIKTVRRGGG